MVQVEQRSKGIKSDRKRSDISASARI